MRNKTEKARAYWRRHSSDYTDRDGRRVEVRWWGPIDVRGSGHGEAREL